MNACDAAGDRRFREILSKVDRRPEWVRNVSLRYGEDASGDPAVWIVVAAEDDLNPSKEKLTAINEYFDALRTEFRATGTERWPYFVIETE